MSWINRPLPHAGDPAGMFSASHDRRRHILLARFTGHVGSEAFAEFDRILAVVGEAEGAVAAFLDLTGIDGFEMPFDFIAPCNRRPPNLPDCKRIFVVQDALTARLIQGYIDRCALDGFHSMLLAPSVDSAVALLDVGAVSFCPIDIEWLRKDLQEDAEFAAEIARLH